MTKKKELKYLVTMDKWFHAPDGRMYSGAWGKLEIIPDSILGIKTNRNSTNWYAKIGNEDKHVIVAGCQIHYAVLCPEKPYIKKGFNWEVPQKDKKVAQEYTKPTSIYIAED